MRRTKPLPDPEPLPVAVLRAALAHGARLPPLVFHGLPLAGARELAAFAESMDRRVTTTMGQEGEWHWLAVRLPQGRYGVTSCA